MTNIRRPKGAYRARLASEGYFDPAGQFAAETLAFQAAEVVETIVEAITFEPQDFGSSSGFDGSGGGF